MQGNVGHIGPGIQASYTWSKSLDDTSSVIGGNVAGGAAAPAWPQNPFDTRAEKGPIDIRRSACIHRERGTGSARRSSLVSSALGRKLIAGWQLLSISIITSGTPFTVYSGVQQTGVGANGVDRPDQIAKPNFVNQPEDSRRLFRNGRKQCILFRNSVNVPGGTGPNHGRFGVLGRDTFRGPAFHNFDFALIKIRRSGREAAANSATFSFGRNFSTCST